MIVLILCLIMQKYGGKMMSEILNPTTDIEIDYENIENLYQKIFKLLSKREFFKDPEAILGFHLGALVNDTIFRQQKYFKTNGLLKKTIPFINFIDLIQVKGIYQYCNRLQSDIVKKEYKKLHPVKKSFLIKIVNNLIDEFKVPVFRISQENLNLAFITGYNFYSRIWNILNNKSKILKLEDFWPNLEFENKIYPQINELMRKPKIVSNLSFHFGIYFGLYYFNISYKQKDKFKTVSLIKNGYKIIKDFNENSIKKLIAHINKVNIKISASNNNKNKSDDSKNSFGVFLVHNELELLCFNMLTKEDFVWDYNMVVLGVIAARTLIDLNIPSSVESKESDIELDGSDITDLDENFLDEEKETNSDENATSQDEKIFISYDEYKKYIEEREFSNLDNKLSFLTGIFLNRLSYSEKKLLNTERLKKRFSFLIKKMSYKNLENLIIEIFKSYISCWIKSNIVSEKESFIVFKELRFDLIITFGELDNFSIPEPDIILYLIKGYHCPRALFWGKKIGDNK